MQTEVKETLAIASVPCQKWGELYKEDTALKTGTVFPDLNKPFYVTEELGNSSVTAGGNTAVSQSGLQDREMLMNRINQVSFFLNDLTLYLDTHCEDQEALRVFAEKGKERSELLAQFAESYYPLTVDCIAKCSRNTQENLWAKGPVPWEGACV